jgi:hypothetical protein
MQTLAENPTGLEGDSALLCQRQPTHYQGTREKNLTKINVSYLTKYHNGKVAVAVLHLPPVTKFMCKSIVVDFVV